MKKIFLLISSLCFINLSCESETITSKSDLNSLIKGNWYMSNNQNGNYNFYAEILFNKQKAYVFNEKGGLMPPIKYLIENDTLFFITNDNQKVNNGFIKIIDENSIRLKTNDNELVLKKIQQCYNLEDFISNNEDAYISDFYDRMLIWREENDIAPMLESEFESIEE